MQISQIFFKPLFLMGVFVCSQISGCLYPTDSHENKDVTTTSTTQIVDATCYHETISNGSCGDCCNPGAPNRPADSPVVFTENGIGYTGIKFSLDADCGQIHTPLHVKVMGEYDGGEYFSSIRNLSHIAQVSSDQSDTVSVVSRQQGTGFDITFSSSDFATLTATIGELSISTEFSAIDPSIQERPVLLRKPRPDGCSVALYRTQTSQQASCDSVREYLPGFDQPELNISWITIGDGIYDFTAVDSYCQFEYAPQFSPWLTTIPEIYVP